MVTSLLNVSSSVGRNSSTLSGRQCVSWPQSPQTPTVPCYDVAWDDAPPRWHVLLLDVSPTHDHDPKPLTLAQRRFLTPGHANDLSSPKPYSDRIYESIAEMFASLHARWWNDSLIDVKRHSKSPGGPHCVAAVPSRDEILTIARHRFEYDLPAYRTQHPDDHPDGVWQMCERTIQAWPELLIQRASAGNLTLVQSDSHLGNILLDRNSESSHVYILDWDAYQRGIGPWDLACLLTLSYAPDIRRKVELELLRVYHRALLARGVADYSFDQCVADYRLAIFISPFVPIAWGKPEFVSYALTAFGDWDCADLMAH